MINLHLTKITKLFDLENLELYGNTSYFPVNLIPENLGEIQDLLFDAQDVWFKLGLGLQIEKEKLESIECDHHNVSSCFREMLYYWLKMVYPSTSWEGLISALTKKSVGCDNVAEAIKLMLLPQDAGKAISTAEGIKRALLYIMFTTLLVAYQSYSYIHTSMTK